MRSLVEVVVERCRTPPSRATRRRSRRRPRGRRRTRSTRSGRPARAPPRPARRRASRSCARREVEHRAERADDEVGRLVEPELAHVARAGGRARRPRRRRVSARPSSIAAESVDADHPAARSLRDRNRDAAVADGELDDRAVRLARRARRRSRRPPSSAPSTRRRRARTRRSRSRAPFKQLAARPDTLARSMDVDALERGGSRGGRRGVARRTRSRRCGSSTSAARARSSSRCARCATARRA